jgi:hypothetical protein
MRKTAEFGKGTHEHQQRQGVPDISKTMPQPSTNANPTKHNNANTKFIGR